MGLGSADASKSLTVITRMRDEGLLPGLKTAQDRFSGLEERVRKAEAASRDFDRTLSDTTKALREESRQLQASEEAHRKRAEAALAGMNERLSSGVKATGTAMRDAFGVAASAGKAVGGVITGLVGGFAGLAAAARVGESKQKAFNQAVGQFGVNGKQLIADMREASKGMVDEVTMYERTNTALMLINKKAFQEAGGHSKVMTQLLQVAMASARATGESVDYAFQSAVTGIARLSPQWLDNLGIGLRLGDVYEKAAKSLHKTADSMTAAEKQTALLNAVLEQGMENVAKFGISSGGLKTQFEVLGARTKDLAFHLGKAFIGSFTPVVQSMQELVAVADRTVVPLFQRLFEGYSKLPPVIRDTVTAFSASQLAMGPVMGLLEMMGAGGGPVAMAVKALSLVAPVVIGVNSAMLHSEGVKKWIADWQKLERIDAENGMTTVQQAVEGIGRNMSAIFADAATIAQEALDNLARAAGTALDLPNIIDFRELVKSAAEGLRDATGAVEEFLWVWSDAGQQGLEGADRLGAAAEQAAQKYPGLRDEIYQVKEAILTASETITTWRDNLVEAGRWIEEHKTLLLALVGAVAGFKVYTEVAGWIGVAKSAWAGFDALLTASGAGGGSFALARLSLTSLGAAFNPVGLAVIAFGALYATNIGGLRDVTNEFVANASRDLGKLPAVLAAAAVGFGVGGPLGAALGALAASFATNFGNIQGIVSRRLAEVRRDLLALPQATNPWRASMGQLAAGAIRDFDRIKQALGNVRQAWDLAWTGMMLVLRAKYPAIADTIGLIVEAAQRAYKALSFIAPPGMLPGGEGEAGGKGPRTASARRGGGIREYVPGPRPDLPVAGGGGGGAIFSGDEEDEGGDGKGGKKKGKGDKGGKGEGKDPLEQAWNTVNSISGAIRSAIDAMKAAWTEWRGAAPDVVMRQIFDAMSDMADRMIELAGQFNPEKMAEAQAAAQLIQTTAGSMTAAIDALNALARVRFASKERLEQLFTTMADIAAFAFRLQDELLPTGKGGNPMKGGKEGNLETSVQRLSLAQSLAEGITAWAGAIGSISEAMTKAAGMRTGADLGQIETLWRGVLDMAWRVTAYAQDKAGGELTPRTFLEQKDVADALGSWLGRIGEALDVAGKMFKTRPVSLSSMGQAEGIIRGALNMAMALSAELKGAYGEDFLVRLEDISEVQKALAEWPKLLDAAVDLQNKLVEMRPGGNLDALREKVFGVAHIARILTDAWRANFKDSEFLTRTEDAKLVAESLSAWPKLLGDLTGVSSAMLAQAALAQRGLTLSDAALGDVLMGVARIAGRMYSAARGSLGDGPEFQFALEDSRTVADTIAKWVDPLVKVGDILRPLEKLKALSTYGAGIGQADVDRFGDLLMSLAAQGGRVWSAAKAGLAGQHFGASMEESRNIAATFTAWLDMAAKVGAAAQSLRQAGAAGRGGGSREALEAYFGDDGLLTNLATGGWRFVGAVLGRAGAQGEQEISRTVASTFDAWITMVGKAADLTRTLRRGRPEAVSDEALDAYFGPDGLLSRIANGAWPMVRAVMRTAEAGEAQALSKTVADTFSAWVKVITDAAGLGRTLRRALPADAGKLDSVAAALSNVSVLMRQLSEWWARLPDPAADLATRKGVGDALGTWVKLVSDTAALGRTMRKAIEPSGAEWTEAEATLREAWRRAWAMAEAMVPPVYDGKKTLDDFLDESLPRLKAFQEGMQAAMGVWSGLASFRISRLLEPTAAEWAGAEAILRQVWNAAQGIFADSGLAALDVDVVAEWSARWKAFWDAAGEAIGAFGAGAGLADTLSAQRLPSVGRQHLATITAMVRDLYTGLRGLFEELMPEAPGGGDPQRYAEEQAERAAQFKTFLGLAGDVVKNAAEGAKFLTDMASRPDLRALSSGNRTAIVQTARDMFRDLQRLFEDLVPTPSGGQDPERVIADQDRQMERFKGFLAGLTSSISAAGGVVDLLTKVNDAAGRIVTLGASTRAIMRTAARDMVEMMQGLATDFGYGQWAGKNAVDQAAEFAGQLRDVTGAVASIADALLKVDAVFWETVEPVDDPKQDTDPGPAGQRRRNGSATRRIGDAPSGPARRRRILDVTREMLQGAMDTARLMLDLMKSEWLKFKDDMAGEAREADRVLLEVGVYMQKIGEVAATVQGVMAGIQAAAENPLALMPFSEHGAGKNGDRTITRWYSDFAQGVRQRRMDGPGGYMDQLKAGIQRAIRLMSEVITETASSGNLPTDDARTRVALLSDAVHGIIQTILDVQQMPEIELQKLERFVDAARLLASVPMGGAAGVLGSSGGLGGLGGGGFSPVSGLVAGGTLTPGGAAGLLGVAGVAGAHVQPRGGATLPVNPINVHADFDLPAVEVVVNVDGQQVTGGDAVVRRRGAVVGRVKSPTIDRMGKRTPRLGDLWSGSKGYADYRDRVRRQLETS